MSWENEKNIYTSKLKRIVEGVDKIRSFEGNTIITQEKTIELKKLQEIAQKLYEKLDKDEFEIAVVGLEKAGKSTFANALIDCDVLPSAEERCTYTSTCIRYGKDNAATVRFYTTEEFEIAFTDRLKKLGIENASSYTVNSLTLNNYRQLFENCSAEKKELYEKSLNLEIENIITYKNELKKYLDNDELSFYGDKLKSDEFKSFIVDPSHAMAAKDVTVYSSEFDKMPNAIMYDVPGFNSPTEMHQKQTLEKMELADAIIMVTNAASPSITGDVLKIFKNADMDGELLSKKLFVFSNRADGAIDLNKNINTTYYEWVSHYKIFPNEDQSRKRFIFGSAGAYLAEKKKNNGDILNVIEENILNAMEKNKIDDGIQTMRYKLTEYYKNERFEVLKNRINKLWRELNDLLVEAKDVSISDGSPSIDKKKYADITTAFLDKLRVEFKAHLNNVKDDEKGYIKNDHPLKNNILNKINELITVENYSIKEDEIRKIHKEQPGIGTAEQVHSVAIDIRKERFKEMYNRFETGVLECTGSEHKKVCDSIIQGFMQAMGATSVGGGNEKLKSAIKEFFGINDNDINNRFYEGLVERFARDFFEVQILRIPGRERWGKFYEERSNFFSLGVFYADSERNNKITDYINESLNSSMLCKVILYPEYAEAPSKSEVIEKFKKLTGMQKIVNSIEKNIDILISNTGKSTIQILEENFMGFAKKLTGISAEATVISMINDVFGKIIGNKNEAENSDWLNEEKYISNADMSIKTYKDVITAFDQDIKALRVILEKAFVPAIDIEKAFIAHEVNSIENMENLLYTENFRKFVLNNVEKIAASEMEEAQQESTQKALNEAAVYEIKKILDQIASDAISNSQEGNN